MLTKAVNVTISPEVAIEKGASAQLNLRNRGILVEWLAEVAMVWSLPPCRVFHAVRYLDSYLAATPLPSLKRLQLVGIACLRAALQRPSQVSIGALFARVRDADTQGDWGSSGDMALGRFVDICADAYDSDEVEGMTRRVSEHVSDAEREAPTAVTFLEELLLVEAGTAPHPGSTHIAHVDVGRREVPLEARPRPAAVGTPVACLASFLLALSLLCPRCCAAPPAHVAGAALSLAREALAGGGDGCGWGPRLQLRALAGEGELAPLRGAIREAQMREAVPNLRRTWQEVLAAVQWDKPRVAASSPAEAGVGDPWVAEKGAHVVGTVAHEGVIASWAPMAGSVAAVAS